MENFDPRKIVEFIVSDFTSLLSSARLTVLVAVFMSTLAAGCSDGGRQAQPPPTVAQRVVNPSADEIADRDAIVFPGLSVVDDSSAALRLKQIGK